MEENKILYVEPCAGLGNRLLALGSAIYWANKRGYRLVVIWKKETACAVTWNSIFSNELDFDVVEVNQLPKQLTNYFQVTRDSGLIKKLSKNARVVECNQIDIDEVDNIFDDGVKLYIKSYSQFAPQKEMEDCIRQIKFARAIVDRVDTIMNAPGMKVGVHIRRTDHANAISKSPTYLYEEKMREILTDDMRFYVASDSEDEIKGLERQFSCIKHQCYSNEVSRVSENGMKDAIVDMLCLSKCSMIIGAYGSTFSRLAAIIGEIPLVVVSN